MSCHTTYFVFSEIEKIIQWKQCYRLCKLCYSQTSFSNTTNSNWPGSRVSSEVSLACRRSWHTTCLYQTPITATKRQSWEVSPFWSGRILPATYLQGWRWSGRKIDRMGKVLQFCSTTWCPSRKNTLRDLERKAIMINDTVRQLCAYHNFHSLSGQRILQLNLLNHCACLTLSISRRKSIATIGDGVFVVGWSAF